MATNINQNRFDSTKASLFILLAFFISIALTYFVFIPDIRSLKLSVMTKDRADIALQQVKTELKLQESNIADIRIKNATSLLALSNFFSTDDFHSEVSKFFSNIKIKKLSEKPMPHKVLQNIEIEEYSIIAELKDPNNFYDFIEFLNTYKNVIEIALPIAVNVDKDYILRWEFNIKVYTAHPAEEVM